MPYADPEKKRQYMKKYNHKWYSANKDTRGLVDRAVDRKKSLRMKKRAWLVDALNSKCVNTGETDPSKLEVHLKDLEKRARWGGDSGVTDNAGNAKAIYDYSWAELQNHLPNFELRGKSK